MAGESPYLTWAISQTMRQEGKGYGAVLVTKKGEGDYNYCLFKTSGVEKEKGKVGRPAIFCGHP